jgi:transposase
MSRARAAECAGIGVSTYKGWRKRAETGEEPFASFLADVKEAETEAEAELLERIREHSLTTWQAGAWLLERRYPERYSLKQRIAHEVTMTPEQARAKYRELTGTDWPGGDKP